jgi:U3 small nucleolar RNA-associated protein 21
MHIKAKAKRLKVTESELKLPEATSLAFATVRERDWANLVTSHAGDSTAYTWMLAKYR